MSYLVIGTVCPEIIKKNTIPSSGCVQHCVIAWKNRINVNFVCAPYVGT